MDVVDMNVENFKIELQNAMYFGMVVLVYVLYRRLVQSFLS